MFDIDVAKRVAELKLEGMCCSQIVLKIAGLEAQGKENDELVQAMQGLAYGMYEQHACGSLTGGCCALALYDFDKDDLVDACCELNAWFESTFGGADCRDLLGLGGAPAPVCKDSMVRTVEKCLSILEDHDFI